VGLVAETVGLAEQIAGADLVLTGEGTLDAQTGSGKVVAGVVALAARYGVPVIAFAGRIPDPEVIQALGLAGAVAITTSELPFAQAVARAPELLSAAVASTLAAWPKGPA
jgi:glycerate kinase